MDIQLRPTVDSDLPMIFKIVGNPSVAPFQYPLKSTTFDDWCEEYEQSKKSSFYRVEHLTILYDGQPAGTLLSNFRKEQDYEFVYAGWNLDPAFWGKGIMTLALAQSFGEFLDSDETRIVIADCFPTNERCLRLLDRLGFQRSSITLWERIRTAYTLGAFRWTWRFVLSQDRWKEASIRLAEERYIRQELPKNCS